MTPGRALIALGALLAVAGVLIEFVPAARLGRLPGDLSFNSGNLKVFIPLGTSLLVSILLTIVLALMNRR